MKGNEMAFVDVVELTIVVEVQLDPVPGTFHTEESAQEVVERLLQHVLNTNIPHYHPVVKLT